MIRSMTGFGQAEKKLEGFLCRVEIKTVNHRFFNVNFRLPSNSGRLETEIQKVLQEEITRGHVNYSLTFRNSDYEVHQNLPVLDWERAAIHHEALSALKEQFDITEEIGLSHIMGESFRRNSEMIPIENFQTEDIAELTREALKELIEFRTHEGLNIERDLQERLMFLGEVLRGIEKRAPDRLVSERDRLQRSVQELCGRDVFDQDRLAREIAILADKWDISEEAVRLHSHLDLFSLTMNENTSLPAGKKLGFILQEILREVNTISAKANDSVISKATIECKEEIERIREQLENIE